METLALPSLLDLKAASILQQQFLERRGAALKVDASLVERLGGLCLQVLLSARASWAADRHSLLVESPSQEFQAALAGFGVSLPALSYQEE